MRIPADASFSACEAAITALAQRSVEEPLIIPTRLKYLAAGGEAAWAQFLISWANTTNSRTIRTFAQSTEDSQIDEFTRRLYGLIATFCAKTIYSQDGQIDLTSAFRKAALERLDRLQSRDPGGATRGPSVEVIAADHLSRSTPVFLYHKSVHGWRELRPREHFVRLANYLITTTVQSGSDKLTRAGADRAIGNLLYETFKNTEDHAIADLNGDVLPLSFRLLQASTLHPNLNALNNIAGDYEPLAKYFSRHSPGPGKSQVPFFCLSVLDSGPGFAQSLTGQNLETLSLEEERDATRECFSEGTRKNNPRFGKGLPLVRSLLRASGGFLRLRTGRLSLFYDSANDADGTTESAPLEEWLLPRALSPVSGTLLTIIIPVGSAA